MDFGVGWIAGYGNLGEFLGSETFNMCRYVYKFFLTSVCVRSLRSKMKIISELPVTEGG